MSLGDEPIRDGHHAEPAEEPAYLSEPEPSGEVLDQSGHFSVVVSDDGSATLNGQPVPVADGEPAHAAILDILHNIAIDLGGNVTAAISDPGAEYTALVEISPDGSSRLLDQEEPPPEAGPRPALTSSEDASTTAQFEPASAQRPLEFEDSSDGSEDSVVHRPDDGPDREEPRAAPSFLGIRRPGRSDGARGARQSGDEYKHQSVLNKPFVMGPAALVAAAVVIVPMLMLGSDGSDEDGGARKAEAGTSSETGTPLTAEEPPPTVSLTPSTPSASPSPKTSESAPTVRKSPPAPPVKAPEPTADGRPTTTTTNNEPSQDTAAAAVRRLAGKASSSPHICYRAYVAGQGWQKPVCDGTMAGGDLPIKALNIATTGVGGTAANAFTYKAGSADGRGEWNRWTRVVGDGRDNYIGRPNAGAPNMLGFAINIGKGQLCHVARSRDSDGGKRACVKPRPAFTYSGSLLNKAWLRAVEFTV
ncbi:hypothetical protein [Streptomyces lienomycini]|uniref:Hydrophobic W protein n=1 Tax=Streptomyces lienomycini TaxID=284035 RepID=A0ABV9X9D7_9ACTN